MIQRKQTKRRFSPEFKREAIEQALKYQQRAVDRVREAIKDGVFKTVAQWARHCSLFAL